MAAENKTKNTSKTVQSQYVNSSDTYDYVKPCPNDCGDFGN